jgi:AraC-like DNA-binding protein
VTIGSTRAARLAGTHVASAATHAIRAEVDAKATRSNGLIPIGATAGFGDVSNFNRAFRAEFGVSPRFYRQHPRR